MLANFDITGSTYRQSTNRFRAYFNVLETSYEWESQTVVGHHMDTEN